MLKLAYDIGSRFRFCPEQVLACVFGGMNQFIFRNFRRTRKENVGGGGVEHSLHASVGIASLLPRETCDRDLS